MFNFNEENDMVQNDERLESLNKALKQREDIYMLFNSERGKRVLEHMAEMVGRSYHETNEIFNTSMPVSTTEFMYMREGQATVVAFIKRAMAYYRAEMKLVE